VGQIARKIQANVNTRARRYRYMQTTESLYEVQSKETLKEYIVDIDKHTCNCREWQASGIPCGHALAVILGRQEDPQLYAKPFYTLEAHRNCYANAIIHPRNNDFGQPLTLSSSEEDSEEGEGEGDDMLLPPTTRRAPGRPKKRRIHGKNEDEAQRIQKCTLCRKVGHSRRTCKEPVN